ncbi:sirohydrochlorin cobaltochelatase [Thiorhodovibrio winogradskyi]|uniref:Sirohydrochlorin cobaltochelatase n=1 Tax=Thiorhodovibrio winogradskyi TaxID=77007 RepID=A0ABZ0S9A3_9GAMM|nr:CbiX/SirB N-terminal domain-containing protein [Thiorhodovibrio winogradskyi]
MIQWRGYSRSAPAPVLALALALALALICALLLGGATGCSNEASSATLGVEPTDKVGVLLVSHGSRSKRWRQMLLDVEQAVREPLLDMPEVEAVRSAFMEESEPSITTQLKAFDREDFDAIILVPVFLTVSSHSVNDIPTIVGMQSNPETLERLTKEKIAIYRPQARVTLVPTLDFTTLLKDNVTARAERLIEQPEDTGVVLVAYGDARYNQQWEELMSELGRALKAKLGIETVAYAWCGHLVDYSPEPTQRAIEQVLELEPRAAVLPLLVAYDPMFQDDVIGAAVEQSPRSDDILYRPDAILPDENLHRWILDIVQQTLVES